MSLILISNLNHVLKKIKFIFNFKNKIKIKFFHVAERYHLPTVICLRWCASCSSKTICYVKKTALILQREIYIDTEHKAQRKRDNVDVDKIWTKFGLDSYYQKGVDRSKTKL